MRKANALVGSLAKPSAPVQLSGRTEAFVVGCTAMIAAGPAIVALYLLKSALGINLMAGPSPLHSLFYHFVR